MVCHPRPLALWCRCLWALLLSSALLLSVLRGSSEAQITPDGSLGPRGPLQGPNYRIGAELGQIPGSNLFHSFGAFNVPTGGSATFSGSPAIANILSRVTGGQPSAIDGIIRSEIAGANLYLLNPSGVLFGQNASLDVRGSFHVSTANFLRLADGAKFFADLGQASGLTVAPPVAFGFLGSTPAPITIQRSGLRVPTGRVLSVVGGDIEMVGNGSLTANTRPTLGAPSGRVQLASVASPGEVLFNPLELAPDLRVDSFARLGRLEFSQGALVDASGVGVAGSGGPGGSVLIRSGRLLVDRSAILANTLGRMDGAGLGLDLRIAADAVLTNDSELRASPRGAGHGGDIAVHVGSLTLTEGSGIFTSSFDAGHSGELHVAATEAISIAGRDTQRNPSGLCQGGTISASSSGQGDAGNIVIRAGQLFRSRNGAVATEAARRRMEQFMASGGQTREAELDLGAFVENFAH